MTVLGNFPLGENTFGEDADDSGVEGARDYRYAFIVSGAPVTASRSAYLVNIVEQIVSERSSYIQSYTGNPTGLRRAFIAGPRSTITGNRKGYIINYVGNNQVFRMSYIEGRLLSISSFSSTRSLYVNGVVNSSTGARNSFITSYDVVGYWPMDDGATDPGALSVRDESSVNNPGAVSGFPTWVEGPSCS